MTKLSYIIFDFDGTLDNQMPSYTKAFVNVCLEKGLSPEMEGGLAAEFNNSAGSPLRQQFLEVFSHSGIKVDLESCVRRFREITRGHKAKPFPGVPEVIHSLFQQQRQLYLTTGSKTEDALQRMGEMGIRQYFSLVLGDEENVQKGPAHLQRFQGHSGDPDFGQKALYLGDGTADMNFARDFEITAVGITNTVPDQKLMEAGARYIIGNLAEFVPLLERIK